MARRKKEDAQISLFPFMSILASLIGILTLMISVSIMINDKQQGQTQEEIDRAKENKALRDQAKKLEEELKKLKEKAEKELKAQSEMQKLQEEMKKLSAKMDTLPDDSLTPDQLRQMINMINQEAVDIRKAQPPLNAELDRLKAELAKLKEIPPPKEYVKISPPKMGSSIPRNLWFVECNSTGLVIRGPNDSEIRVTPVEAIPNNMEYLELCTKIEKMGQNNAMLVFLVRTDGKKAYEWAAGVADSKFSIRLGRIPVAHNARIDLSAFRLR